MGHMDGGSTGVRAPAGLPLDTPHLEALLSHVTILPLPPYNTHLVLHAPHSLVAHNPVLDGGRAADQQPARQRQPAGQGSQADRPSQGAAQPAAAAAMHVPGTGRGAEGRGGQAAERRVSWQGRTRGRAWPCPSPRALPLPTLRCASASRHRPF